MQNRLFPKASAMAIVVGLFSSGCGLDTYGSRPVDGIPATGGGGGEGGGGGQGGFGSTSGGMGGSGGVLPGSCDVGLTFCASTSDCVDTNKSAEHCGACDTPCTGGKGMIATCYNGKCNRACDFGIVDADLDPANGCEASDPSVLLWLDASEIQGLAAGDSVATWPDKSSAKRDATQSGNGQKPKYQPTQGPGGKPAVVFDGNDDRLIVPPLQLFKGSADGLTIAVVFKSDGLGSQRFLLMQPQTNCTNNLELGTHTGQADRDNFGLHRGCSHASVTKSNITSQWYRMVVDIGSIGAKPNNIAIWQDGILQELEVDVNGWPEPGGYGTLTKKIVVGGRDDNDDNKFNSHHKGAIAEIIVMTGSLDAGRQSALEGYLTTKYPL